MRTTHLLSFVAFLLFPSPGSIFAQPRPPTCDDLQPRMISRQISDLAVAVFRSGKVTTLYCSTTPVNLSPNSIFQAASLSKPVFTLGVLSLVYAGKLDLDRPLRTYLNCPYLHPQTESATGPEDTVSDPRLNRVNARMVLDHTSGLPNWARNQPLTFLHDPGQQWSYSSEAYLYLQAAVASITGQPLDVFLRDSVLTPLGMTHSPSG